MTATRCWRPSCSPGIPATMSSCRPRRPYLARQIAAGRLPPARQGEAAQPEEPRSARRWRSPPSPIPATVRRAVSVGRHRHRLQRRHGRAGAGRGDAARHARAAVRSGEREKAGGLRHLAARHRAGGFSRRARLSRPRPEEPRSRRSRQGARPLLDAIRPLRAQVPLVAIHQRPRQRRSVHLARLFGRRDPGAQPRRARPKTASRSPFACRKGAR